MKRCIQTARVVALTSARDDHSGDTERGEPDCDGATARKTSGSNGNRRHRPKRVRIREPRQQSGNVGDQRKGNEGHLTRNLGPSEAIAAINALRSDPSFCVPEARSMRLGAEV
jgi:hypothetical protein